MNMLIGYIPTEVLTCYVAVLAAIHGPAKATHGPEWKTFVAFLIATPIVLWIVYATKLLDANKPLPLLPWRWPLWEMFAAAIAYCAWAFALPDNPFTDYAWYSSGLAAIAVLLVSTVLGLLAPLLGRGRLVVIQSIPNSLK